MSDPIATAPTEKPPSDDGDAKVSWSFIVVDAGAYWVGAVLEYPVCLSSPIIDVAGLPFVCTHRSLMLLVDGIVE
jgi:hypothetical protein